MNKKERKTKYLKRYIGIRSPLDGMLIENLDQLHNMLEEDDCYVRLGKIFIEYFDKPFDEWCIIKVSKFPENVIDKLKITERIYANPLPRLVNSQIG